MYLLFISIFSYGIKADATLEMEQRDFIRAGLEYVCLIQEVQERKKFEFVETVSLIVAALGIYPTHLFSYMYKIPLCENSLFVIALFLFGLY